eukprot:CAMPEP_0185773150 /NCGR_PEP_ID=MMETSP1174-20130828/72325_1 /TAXON_ID=35687 /ORGANISM="Dictyocha speculum, Strain CCMP1381" /LENGTH=126 /DNA_ID=CAMNT_0028459711 /DNA_START=734 /DNA_END=1114 /DNA_ORIENTATION=-
MIMLSSRGIRRSASSVMPSVAPYLKVTTLSGTSLAAELFRVSGSKTLEIEVIALRPQGFSIRGFLLTGDPNTLLRILEERCASCSLLLRRLDLAENFDLPSVVVVTSGVPGGRSFDAEKEESIIEA